MTQEILIENPTHPVVKVLIWTYTADGFVFKILNESSRLANHEKVASMGPYAFALSRIIQLAGKLRKDIDPSDFSNCLLYRGSGLKES